MSKNSAAHQKKVEHAVWKILKAAGLSIPDAMVLAKFSKKDVANETKQLSQAVSTGNNFLYLIPLFCIRLGTIGVLLRYFYSPKDL
jgi:hypothetical protein